MRLLFFILFIILNHRTIATTPSFKEYYHNADIKIKFRNGHVSINTPDGRSITKTRLTSNSTKIADDSFMFSISLTDRGEFSINNLNDTVYSYAIDSDQAVCIQNNNRSHDIAIRSNNYIVNVGNLLADSFTFYSSRIFNFGGLGKSVDFAGTIKNKSFYETYKDACFYNFGTINYDTIETDNLHINQSGIFVTKQLTQNTSYSDGNVLIINKNDDSNCNVYTQINTLNTHTGLYKRDDSIIQIDDWDGIKIGTQDDGTLTYNTQHSEKTTLSHKTNRLSCGIPNLGSTCYLNTAIQMIYAIDDYRDIILHYTGNDELIIVLNKLFQKLQCNSLNHECTQALLTKLHQLLRNTTLDTSTGQSPIVYGDELIWHIAQKLNTYCTCSYIYTLDNQTKVQSLVKLNLIGSVQHTNKTANLSELLSQNKAFKIIRTCGDYVFVVIISDDYNKAHNITFDNITLQQEMYEPIAAISIDSGHSWTTVKQLDGTFIQYDDELTSEIDGFDDHTMTVLYKRLTAN